jgi:hypothetical protein
VRETAYYLAPDRAAPDVSRFVVDGLSLLGLALLGFALVRRAQAIGRARLAAATAKDAAAPLHLGPCVIAGTVLAEGEGAPITVEIEQTGREWTTNKRRTRWEHRWSEQRRKVTVRPFYVAREGGERVRIEPNDRAFLVDKLDRTVDTGHRVRLRSAQLSAGERVYISGEMVRASDPGLGGYREGAEGWILRPPRDGRMLVSTEPLDARHRDRGRVYRNLALQAAVVLAILNGAIFLPYQVLRLTGRPVEATVISTNTTREWVTRKRGGYWRYHRWLVAAADSPEPLALHAEISRQFLNDLDAGVHPKTAPFVVSTRWPSFQLVGSAPTATANALGLGVLLGAGFAIFYVLRAVRSRPWYDRRRVIESGHGRLYPT